ncbi:mammalian cell entry protein [Mycolicibacterium moriokaense]|uniref:Mce family protein Mce3D n=1 Tax=Mycolicibacterium moriokaense TaxID=39691 RepID=A0AAD1H544_9MYCO|nr:virulence factor Mce family protein [Mycolicibacterium moriokaense]MCV7042454.1 virulence factor Mce family protein [Mycolicibacterium moriokaense]ORB22951.1 mammalian cell entry protein [Mycolicibacterium moriokaense]BBW99127.1 Mce family protein Mce3D [Mycolicibacterium moriokaense]
MTNTRISRIALAIVLTMCLVAGVVVAVQMRTSIGKTLMVGYFDNSNGLYAGDEVRILGVPVGEIDTIEPQAQRVKISFWVDNKYKVPADVTAAIVSPQLITSRAIQLTPAYTSGPVMDSGAVIPQERTAVPVEWDDLRTQLQTLTDMLQPTQPGGVSTLGAFINTAADNVRGQGVNIRDALIKMSQAFSIFGDHSQDIFGTIKNLSVLVSALQDSTTVLGQLNRNLAAVTALLADNPDQIGQAVADLSTAANDVQSFVADNRDALGTTTDKLSSISAAVIDSLDDIKQTLHIAPNAFQNFLNIYQPSQAALTGALALNNFANPITFLCGAIQAASRLNSEQAAKLCVQYLAPIVKNRQFNFPPLGENLFVGAAARPNELTYSEDWLRPDYVPPMAAVPSGGPPGPQPPAEAPLPAEAPAPTDPSAGLPGMMVPGGGS